MRFLKNGRVFPAMSSKWLSVISRNSTSFRLFGANFLDSEPDDDKSFFSSRLSICSPFLWAFRKLDTIPGSLLLIRLKNSQNSRRYDTKRPYPMPKNWDRKKTRKFPISKISIFIENCMKIENFEIGNFRKFLRFSKIFEIENFSFFIENCMKIENFEIENFRKIFRSHFLVTRCGRFVTYLCEFFMKSLRIKSKWKLWSSTFRKIVVYLCSGARKMIKSLFYFLVTPKPMDTTKNLDICSQFREITL